MRTRVIEFNGQIAEVDIDAITYGHIEIKSKQTGAHEVAFYAYKDKVASFVVYSMDKAMEFIGHVMANMKEEDAKYFPKEKK